MFDQSVHDDIKRKYKTLAIYVSVLVLVFTALRLILTRFFVDPDIHFYIDTSNIFVASYDYVLTACILIIYIASLFMYKYKKDSRKYIEISDCFVQGTQAQVFSASLTGFLFIAASIFQVYSFLYPGNSYSALKGVPLADRFTVYIHHYTFDFIIFFVALLSSVYFFKTAALNFDIGDDIRYLPADETESEINGDENYENIEIEYEEKTDAANENKSGDNNGKSKYKYTSAHIIFSFMPILWSFVNIFKCFFDMSKAVNSPIRIYELISFLVLSAYFVSESRMLVERRESSRFFTFAYISAIIVSVSSLPNLIWSSFWILQPNSDQIVYALELSFVIYILSRVYSQIRYGRFLLQR